MVHASLSGTGTAPATVRDALIDALGPGGTLVVPAFTPENSDTSRAHRRLIEGLDQRQVREIRATMPPYDPDTTPCTTMGALAECVRTTPGSVRSAHPQTSLAGLGPRAADLLGDHHPHCHLGERSPLARLYEADARVLLLRVGFDVCSALHLAEYRTSPPPPRRTYRCVTEAKGNWIEYEDAVLDDSNFAAVGERLPKGLLVRREWSGRPVVQFRMRPVVDEAVRQLSLHSSGLA
ncbi:AAC(3) family N-acetyltransferase [Streptomyces sp. DSM 41972]|uniref:AAC(3) family N-acetyltransferase n=1 Tax=Streptomyces althioticus subsp. attaecolombicae TaxID=3075534 RepID=A0ABU3I456_9ACTN|nr:AAC(3) family N-acetyltransferase [Streptomyces sp. DSM 41972]SCD60756.1 aminoglycoside 3-N-acetyltransferase [Streptomyces sp. di50b]SCD61020.1 aminoglycoside 3-N-acetyltransferase [Streptomyces sp. di188]